MFWPGLIRPIVDELVLPGSNVIRCAGPPGTGVIGPGPGVTAAGTEPAEFLGILMLPTSPPGFTFCRTTTSALNVWAMEAHVSPDRTV